MDGKRNGKEYQGRRCKKMSIGKLKINAAVRLLVMGAVICITGCKDETFYPKKIVLPLPGKAAAPLELLRMKPGKFMMGTNPDEKSDEGNEKYKKAIINKHFWIGKFEVTQEQWQSLMGNNPSKYKAKNHPVEEVGYYQSLEFCKKLNKLHADKLPAGYRFYLPSETEWEYACRAGTVTALNSGKNLSGEGKFKQSDANLDEVGWYEVNSRGNHQPIGLKKPNAWGLYDMHGNVREWTRSWDLTWYVNSGGRKITRGGSFFDMAKFCSSAIRTSTNQCGLGDNLGFRVALVKIADIERDEAEEIPEPTEEEYNGVNQ